MISAENSMTVKFKGALLDIYHAALDRAVASDLSDLSPEQFASIATSAIRDSLGGQVRYFSKDRKAPRAESNVEYNHAGDTALGFKGTLLLIYRSIFAKAAASDLANLSPKQFANIATTAIKQSLGGQLFYIPMGLDGARHDRDMKICEAWEAGLATIGELAIRFEMSQQQIYALLNRLSDKYRSSHSGLREARKVRNEKLVAGRIAGATYRELGQEFGLCAYYVREIIQKYSK